MADPRGRSNGPSSHQPFSRVLAPVLGCGTRRSTTSKANSNPGAGSQRFGSCNRIWQVNLTLHVVCPRPKEGFWLRHSPTEPNGITAFCEATSSRPGKHRSSKRPRASPNAASCHSAQSPCCRDAEPSRCGQWGVGASCTLPKSLRPLQPLAATRERQERSSRARGRCQLDTTVVWRAKEPPFDAYPAFDLSLHPRCRDNLCPGQPWSRRPGASLVQLAKLVFALDCMIGLLLDHDLGSAVGPHFDWATVARKPGSSPLNSMCYCVHSPSRCAITRLRYSIELLVHKGLHFG